MTPALTGSARSQDDFLERHIPAQPTVSQEQEDAVGRAAANMGPGWILIRQVHGSGAEPDAVLHALVHKDVGVALLGEVPDLMAIERLRGNLHAAGFVQTFGGYPPIVFRVMPPSELPLEDLLDAAFSLEPRLSLADGKGWERALCEILAGGKASAKEGLEEPATVARGSDEPQAAEPDKAAGEEAASLVPDGATPEVQLAPLPNATEQDSCAGPDLGTHGQSTSSGFPVHSPARRLDTGSTRPVEAVPGAGAQESQPGASRRPGRLRVALSVGTVLVLVAGGFAAFDKGATFLDPTAVGKSDGTPGPVPPEPRPHPAAAAHEQLGAPVVMAADPGAPRAIADEPPEPRTAGTDTGDSAGPGLATEPVSPEMSEVGLPETVAPRAPEDRARSGSEPAVPHSPLGFPGMAASGSPDTVSTPVERPVPEIERNPQEASTAPDVQSAVPAFTQAEALASRAEVGGPAPADGNPDPVHPALTKPASAEGTEPAMPAAVALPDSQGEQARPDLEPPLLRNSTEPSGVAAPVSQDAAPVVAAAPSTPAQNPATPFSPVQREEASRPREAVASMPVRPSEGAEPPARPNAMTRQVQMAPAMLLALIQRGDAMLALGDLSAARLLYERAAAGGNGRAATAAGRTYDPAFLARFGAVIPSDPAKAADWYRRAIALGDREAEEALAGLETTKE